MYVSGAHRWFSTGKTTMWPLCSSPSKLKKEGAQSWQMCCQSQRLSGLWKIAFMSKPDYLDWRYTWKVVEALQGKTFWWEYLSLYHEGSCLSVDTFGAAACPVCPEAVVVFPCGACVHVHAHLSVRACVAVDSKPFPPKLVHFSCDAVHSMLRHLKPGRASWYIQ